MSSSFLLRQTRQALHALQKTLILAPLGEDLGDVGTLEELALRARGQHLGNVLPPLLLLERLDLAVQAKEVLREVRLHAEALEGGAERMLRGDRPQQAFAGSAALPQPQRPLPHFLLHFRGWTEMERRDGLLGRTVHQKPLGDIAAGNRLGRRRPAEEVGACDAQRLLAEVSPELHVVAREKTAGLGRERLRDRPKGLTLRE